MSSMQRYVSQELTHFVGRSASSDEERYDILKRILRAGWITHAPHENKPTSNLIINSNKDFSSNQMYCPDVICFCDIPVDDLDIHVGKYSRFGLSFHKSYLVSEGVNPVFYISAKSEKHGELNAKRFNKMIETFHTLVDDVNREPKDPSEAQEYRKVMSFLKFNVFGFMKFFKHDYPDDSKKNYYMEREWRLIGNLKFDLMKVCRIIIPKEYARRFRKDFPDYHGQLTFL